ncbi:hypothetical protein ACWEQJ_04595, partial [Streptomyces cyaneofuscatus]
MLPVGWITLATVAGKAVASAIGTDAWNDLRERVTLLTRHSPRQPDSTDGASSSARATPEWGAEVLDRTEEEVLAATDEDSRELIRTVVAVKWRRRFLVLLQSLPPGPRDDVAEQLRRLTDAAGGLSVPGEVSGRGPVIGDDPTIHISSGSASAISMGDVVHLQPNSGWSVGATEDAVRERGPTVSRRGDTNITIGVSGPTGSRRGHTNIIIGDISGSAIAFGGNQARFAAGRSDRLLLGTLPARAAGFQRRLHDPERRALPGTDVLEPAWSAPVLTPGRSWVVSGLGGVGKSQLAADYARDRWDSGELDLLVWITPSERPHDPPRTRRRPDP